MKSVVYCVTIILCIKCLTAFGQASVESMPWLPQKKSAKDITSEEWKGMKIITGLFRAPESAPGVSAKPFSAGERPSYYQRYSEGLDRPESWKDVTQEHIVRFDQPNLALLCDMPRIYFTDPTEEGREKAKKVFLQQARLTITNEDQNSGPGKTYLMGRVNFTENMLAMKDVMKEAGIYDDFARVWSMNRRFMLQEFPYENMDWSRDRVTMSWALTANMDDSPEKLHRLRLLQRATSMSYAKLITPDGGGIHHNCDHISYARFSFKSVYSVALKTYGTPFQLSEEVYEHLRAYAWAHGIATVNRIYPDNLCARNNLTPERLDEVEVWIRDFAEKIDTPDRKFAALYLALFGDSTDQHNKITSAQFRREGVKPLDLNVHHSYNISAAAIHRRPDWMVSINGTRYPINGAEMYVMPGSARTFMANSAFGSIQVLTAMNREQQTATLERLKIEHQGDSVEIEKAMKEWTMSRHGYVTDGWDYNHYAGVTAPVLPYDMLMISSKTGSTYNYSEFCGGTSMGENGIWGMIVATAKGYEVCRKSAFCFGKRITILTSDIKPLKIELNTQAAADSTLPIHTTLFQFALDDHSKAIVVRGKKHLEFPFQQCVKLDKPVILMDHLGNSYYVHAGKGNTLHIGRGTQYSYSFTNLREDTPYEVRELRQKNMQMNAMKSVLNYCNPIPGDFSIAYIDHENTTENSGAAFTLYVQNTPSKGELPYEILRQDSVAHILKDCLSHTSGYVVFEAERELGQGVLKNISRPSTVMIQDQNNGVVNCSVSCTDITYDRSILSQKSDRLYKPEEGKKEPLKPIVLEFKGAWSLYGTSHRNIACDVKGEATIVTIPYKDYLPVAFSLKKK